MAIERWWGILCLVVMVGGGRVGAVAAGETITVSAAISLKEVLESAGRAYEKQSADSVKLNFGASGQLAAQIRNGAPVDLFISAAEAQVDQLIKANLADAATRQVLAHNRLVLIVPTGAQHPPGAFTDLAAPSVRRLAIGQPRTVPAGAYAEQVLARLGLDGALKGRLVYGANVRQVLAYVERGEVDAGIVYRTDAAEAGPRVRVMAEAQESWHTPIVYPAVVVKASGHRAAAGRFEAYLQTAVAQKIFEAVGFTAPHGTNGKKATGDGPATKPDGQ
jgi:molybdate transport system substrate-binding protein